MILVKCWILLTKGADEAVNKRSNLGHYASKGFVDICVE